jgi:acetolactate synthase-1/3 small subunit
MKDNRTFTIYTENCPGILHRITTVFTRRKINVESLTVSDTEQHGISRFTIVVKADEAAAIKVAQQIGKVIEVKKSYVHGDSELIFKEIAFLKIATDSVTQRKELEDLAEKYDAEVIQVSETSLVIEKSGSEDEINSLLCLVEPYGVKEFVRSGRIAILKTEEDILTTEPLREDSKCDNLP